MADSQDGRAPRWALPALVALSVLIACGDDDTKAAPAAASAAAAGTTSSAAEAVEAPPIVRERRGSAIAMTMARDALLVASEDHRALFRVALPFSPASEVTRIAMPGAPAQIVALADRVLVTVRDPGQLVELTMGDGGALAIARKLPLAPDAWGLAVTPDGKTAVVTSAWTNTLSGVDVAAMRLRWTQPVAREPRGVVVLRDGKRAYVSHLVGSALTRVDGVDGTTPAVKPVALAPTPSRTPSGATLSAALGYALVTDPSEGRLFAPRHALGAAGAWSFSAGSWWGAPSIDVLRTGDDTPLAPRKNGPNAIARTAARQSQTPTTWPAPYMPEAGADGMHAPLPLVSWDDMPQPRDVVYRKKTDTLLVACEGNATLLELDAHALEPALHAWHRYEVGIDEKKPFVMPGSGGAPSGIVLDEAEDKAYVFGRSTYDVTEIALAADPSLRASPTKPGAVVSLAPDPLLEEVSDSDRMRPARESAVTGRVLYYMANDREMSGGMACAGCHPEGRDDGYTWHLYEHEHRSVLVASPQTAEVSRLTRAQEPPGRARQTPMLAGRVAAKGPYGWNGENETLEARIAAGFDLHHGAGNAPGHALAVSLFLRLGMVPPPKLSRALTPAEERGRALFTSDETGCTACHDPATHYTDRKAVAVQLPERDGFAPEAGVTFKTPSLLWVAGTPPYFHDGSAPSLERLVLDNDDHMGRTSHLSAADKAALVAYLKTL